MPVQETWVQSLGRESPLEKEMATHSSCLENPMDRGALQAMVHEVTRVGHDLVTKPSIILGGFSGGSDSKESACNAEDLGSIPELGRSLGEGNDNPFQYSCLGNSMDRGAWQVTVHGLKRVEQN